MKTKRDFCNRLFNFALVNTWDFIEEDREDFLKMTASTPMEQILAELEEIASDEDTQEYDRKLALGLIEMAKLVA